MFRFFFSERGDVIWHCQIQLSYGIMNNNLPREPLACKPEPAGL